MKCDFRVQNFGFGLVAVGLFTVATSALALTESPYGAIVGRNAFALKPPTPVSNTPTAPVVLPPSIELQGITTILGRPQVLLKIKLPARPPEPAKDQSVVLDVGQREGEVEVLEINVAEGSVKLRNQGAELPLNMRDNAAKPTPGPVLPVPGVTPGGLPSPISAPNPGMSSNPGALPNRTTGGTGGINPPRASVPALPARSLRGRGAGATTDAAATAIGGLSATGGDEPGKSYQPPNSGLTVEEQMAILAVQHEKEKNSPTGAMLPPLPTRYKPE